MAESQPSPSSQKEVLIIPLHPNATPTSATASSLKTKSSATASSLKTKTSATASSLKTKSSVTASSLKTKSSVTASSLKTKSSVTASSLKKTSIATVSSPKGPAVKTLSGGEGRGIVTTAVAVEKSAEEIKQVHIIESQKEVLIIPLHPNATPIQQTSSSSSPQTKSSATASSLKTTSNATVSSPSGPAGSQLFAELLESHARRNPRKASLEPGEATPSSETTPYHVDTPPSPPPPPPPPTSNATVTSPTRPQLFAELLESHARRNPRKASLEPGETTPSSETTPYHVDTPPSPPPPPTSNATVTSPAHSQLFAELLESHARRNPRKASLEPGETTPSSETTPSPVDTPRSMSPSMSPRTTSPQQPSATVPGGSGLSNPQLLKELKQPPPLKHVNAHKGLTTVFSGRGKGLGAQVHQPQGQASDGGQNPQRFSNGMQH